MFEIVKLDVPVNHDNLINKYANEQAKIKAGIIDNLFFEFVSRLGISISPYQNIESIKSMLEEKEIEIVIEYNQKDPEFVKFIAKRIIKTQISKIKL